MLDFSPEAKALWIERYNAIESQLSSHGDFAAIPDVAAKAADNVARLAAVLHVFEHGAAGTISADTVHNAGEIVTWHLYSAKALLGPLSVSKDEANAANLDRWLLDRCAMEGVDGFPTRTLLHSGPNATRKREDFDRAVGLLAEHGRVRLVQSANGAADGQPCAAGRLRHCRQQQSLARLRDGNAASFGNPWLRSR